MSSPLRTRRRFLLFLVCLVVINVVAYFAYYQTDVLVEKPSVLPPVAPLNLYGRPLALSAEPAPLLRPPLPSPPPPNLPSSSPHVNTDAIYFAKVIALIQQERREMPKSGANHLLEKQYSFAVCCITRNELHLKEFLLRNFMAGVEHFYMYDHNHVDEGMDVDIGPVLEPFVKLGIVTRIRWPLKSDDDDSNRKTVEEETKANPPQLFGPGQKAKFMEHCLLTYNHTADWLLRIDTDEHVLIVPPDHTLVGAQQDEEREHTDGYFQRPSHTLESLGYTYDLWPLLEYVKRVPSDVGSLLMQWMIPYPNHTILALKSKPLLDAFPHVCTPRHDLPKPMFRPEIVVEMHDHWVPKRKNGAKEVSSPWPGAKPTGSNPAHAGALIVHYYAKSVQEFLLKKEQSLFAYPRMLNNMYYKEYKASPCDKRLINYPDRYADTLHQLMEILKDVPNSGVFKNAFKGPKPLVYGQHPDFALYAFLKWAVSQHMEWDEEAYLRLHPNVPHIMEASNKSPWPYVDGLHYYFRDGFWGGNHTCWKLMDPNNDQLQRDTLCF